VKSVFEIHLRLHNVVKGLSRSLVTTKQFKILKYTSHSMIRRILPVKNDRNYFFQLKP